MITIIFNHLQWPLCIHIYMSWVMKSWAALHRSYFSHSCHWRRNPARMSQLEMSIEVTATSHYSTLYVWHKFRYYNHMLNHIYIYIVSNDSYILYTYIYIYIFIWYIYNHIYMYSHNTLIYIYLTRSQCSFNKKLPVSSWSRAHCRFGLGNEPRLGSPQWGLRPGSRSVGCSEPSEPRVWRFLF